MMLLLNFFYMFCDVPVGVHLQDSSTHVSLSLIDLHDRVMFLLTTVVIFTSFLVLSSFKQDFRIPRLYVNDVLEFGWILIPVIILYSIAIYSIDLMYIMDEIYDPELTIGITGYQWYWGYNYPEYGQEIESRIISYSQFAKLILNYSNLDSNYNIPVKMRNLEVDNEILIPTDTNIRLVITSADVLHSWSLPSWGIKMDAIPGRINSTGINVHRTGTYYGQCSELCGVLHGFMPIKIKAIYPEEFVNEI